MSGVDESRPRRQKGIFGLQVWVLCGPDCHRAGVSGSSELIARHGRLKCSTTRAEVGLPI